MANPSNSVEYDSPYQEMEVQRSEHRSLSGNGYKAIIPYSFDGTTLVPQPTGLIPSSYDYISFSPDRTNPTTIVFKSGGSGGTTVATLTLDSTSVTKS